MNRAGPETQQGTVRGSRSTRRFVWLAVAALALGAAVVLYRGPGRGVIRGHFGDAAATMLVYAVLGMSWRARVVVRAAAAMAVAAAVEIGQTMWRGEGFLGEMTVGSTFDGWDFVAYGVGVVIAVRWEACDGWDTAIRPPRPPRPAPTLPRPTL
jgi:hypothetical protein